MKMKNMLIGGMSLALVACISIGGTLAYFTARDSEVVNTFRFVQKDDGFANYINVALMEKDPTAELKKTVYGAASAAGNPETGYAYTDVAPGQKLPKEPLVFVHTSVPSYVYLRVTNVGNNNTMTPDILADSGWTALKDVNNVYWMAVTQDSEEELNTEESKEIVGDEDLVGYMQLKSLFKEVTVPAVTESEIKDGAMLNNVKIEVAAIQQAGFADAKDAYDKGHVENIFTGTSVQQ